MEEDYSKVAVSIEDKINQAKKDKKLNRKKEKQLKAKLEILEQQL